MIDPMDMHLIPALALFAAVTSFTPGPNNLMLLASGANFGLRRSLPHMLGIGAGHSAMILALGLGLGEALALVARLAPVLAPLLIPVLRLAAVGYILWLAWRIARGGGPGHAPRAEPFGFFQAVAFQWVNPKAWAMGLGALAAYAPGSEPAAVALVALVFAAISLPSVTAWTLGGTAIARLLRNPRRLRLFNRAMAALLVAALVPVMLG